MKLFKLFGFQLSSFLSNVLLFNGKDVEYKWLGIAAWVAILATAWFIYSILVNIIN